MSNVTDFVLAQYEKNSQAGNSKPRVSDEERLKRYFAPILPKGSQSGEKRIRIVPPKDGGTPFVEVYFHEVQVDGKWVKLYDPSQNGTIGGVKSPLNDVYKALQMTGNEADRTLSYGYKPRKFYVVKVVDRENEQDGIKFWRFKHNYKNEGILDKIIPIWRNKGDITDSEKGRDLIIELSKQKTPKGAAYTTVSTIMYDDPATIHEDSKLMKEWVEDEMTWLDVYSKKPVEYLEAIARGEVPRWDSDKGGYVYGNNEEGTQSFGGYSTPSTPSTPSYSDPQVNSEPDEDLPF